MPNLVRDKCVVSALFVRYLCVIFGLLFIRHSPASTLKNSLPLTPKTTTRIQCTRAVVFSFSEDVYFPK